MIYKELGKTGIKIPAIGIGTWKLGVKPEEERASIKTGLSLGMRFIDTAEMYHTEELVGEAIKGETDVFIATKVSPHHFHYDDVIKSCNQSLKSLGIKTIDLYQLHWPNPNIPIAETMNAMERLVNEGKVRYIGVSNFSVQELKEAQSSMKNYEIVSNQIEYSLFARAAETDIIPFCREQRITVIAYRPLAAGKLYDKGTSAYEALESVAKKTGNTISQIALNWLISKPNVVAIPKAGKIDHMKENAQACDFKLSKEDEFVVRSISSNFTPVSSRLTDFTKRTSGIWSNLLDKREDFRTKYKF